MECRNKTITPCYNSTSREDPEFITKRPFETNVNMKREDRLVKNARICMTKAGNRSFAVNHVLHGKET